MLLISLKKISRNLKCGGRINNSWLKNKVFASLQKKFVTIAYVGYEGICEYVKEELSLQKTNNDGGIKKQQSIWY